MNPKNPKYRINEAHDISINACSVYMALIKQDKVYLMPERLNIEAILNSDCDIIALSRQWGRSARRSPRPRPEFVVLASYPDSRPAMAVYGPLHIKSHHSKLILVDDNTAWYIRIKSNCDYCTEAKIIKEIKLTKLRKTLIDESLEIYQAWLSEQFH
jgi:hypothetical protein